MKKITIVYWDGEKKVKKVRVIEKQYLNIEMSSGVVLGLFLYFKERIKLNYERKRC